MSRNLSGLTEDEIEDLKEAFSMLDTNGNGFIKIEDLKSAINTLGFGNKIRNLFDAYKYFESKGLEVDFETFMDFVSH